MQIYTKSTEETQEIAKKLIREYPGHKIWLLEGELATGKTQLIKGLAKALGIDFDVSSPTFAYINEYGQELVHYDFYRLEGPDDELLHLLAEHLEQDLYLAIEWPSRMQLDIPKAHLKIDIQHKGGDERLIEITPHS